MVQFEDVDEKTRKQLEHKSNKRGAIAKPIIDAFLESGKDMVKVSFDETGSKSIISLYLGLKNHLKTRGEATVEVFMHNNEIYLKKVKEA